MPTLLAPIVTKRVFQRVHVLVMGAMLAIGQRTVTQALRLCGLSRAKNFQNYHRVLNRAVWSGLKASRARLLRLISVFATPGPLVVAIDDTIERRRGDKIQTQGIYRDPVRSSHRHCVKASGRRWLSLMLLAEIPWAGTIWAWPLWTPGRWET